jgi:hypothetical protein
MQHLTNNSGLSLSMAVWLAHDEYTDGSEEFDCDVISATSLLKPTRQFILSQRVPVEDVSIDVMDLFGARHGHALHNDIEHAWTVGYEAAMKRLGYPQKLIDRVRINPDPETVTEDDVPVYLEQRSFRRISVRNQPLVISGKFDQVINGEINDTKKTSVYTYINRSKEDDYALQGSVYRWLNPSMVTSDIMKIQHIFTDWKRGDVSRVKGYPPTPVMEFTVQLMSEKEVEKWIHNKVCEILDNQGLSQDEMIRCTDEQLWRSDPVYKYYADPAKAQTPGARSTRNFASYSEASLFMTKEKKGKGVIVTVPGQVKACRYCRGKSICEQAKEYEENND